ncbi:MAG: LapA family protein [Peptococcales bacterium]
MQFYLVGALLFALLVALFAVQNTIIVKVVFLFWQFEISLVLVILGAASFGALCVLLVGMFRNIGMWRRNRELQNKNKLLTEKVTELEERLNQTVSEESKDNTIKNITTEDEAVQATNTV